MIEIYFKTIRDEKFKKIEDFRIGSWIHVDNAKDEDLETITKLTGLEKADIHDALDKFESPRIEQKEGNILLFVRHPAHTDTGLRTASIAIILTNHYIITITPHESFIADEVASSKLPLATTQKSKLLLYILLKITQDFTSQINLVSHAVIEQEKMTKNITNDDIVQLTKNEDTLNQYLSTLVPMKNLLESITSGRFIHLYEKDYDLLQDLLIAIKQSEDICQVNVKNIRSLRDSYQILFTNDVNKTIKFLTAITIIFTIPTIIASVYGMNVSLPLEKYKHAFAILLVIIAICTFLLFWVFWRKKWL